MRPLTAKVLHAVADKFGLTPDNVLSADRHRSVFEARAIVMLVLRDHFEPHLSFPEIARELRDTDGAKRDHTTVMSALTTIRKKMQNDNTGFLRAALDAGIRAVGPEHTGAATHDALRRRRRQIADALRELVAEAQQIDALLGPVMVKVVQPEERQIGAAE